MRQVSDRYGCRNINLGPCKLSNMEARRPIMLDSPPTKFADSIIYKDIYRSQVML